MKNNLKMLQAAMLILSFSASPAFASNGEDKETHPGILEFLFGSNDKDGKSGDSGTNKNKDAINKDYKKSDLSDSSGSRYKVDPKLVRNARDNNPSYWAAPPPLPISELNKNQHAQQPDASNKDQDVDPTAENKTRCIEFYTKNFQLSADERNKTCTDLGVNFFFSNSKNPDNKDFQDCLLTLNAIPKLNLKKEYFCSSKYQRDDVLSKSFSGCVNNLISLKYSADSSFNRCLRTDRRDIADSTFPQCHSFVKSLEVDDNTAFVKCLDYDFRKTSQDKDFTVCGTELAKLPKMPPVISLEICQQSDLSKKINSKDFQACADSPLFDTSLEKAIFCSNSQFLDNQEDGHFTKCVHDSVKSYYSSSLFSSFFDYMKEVKNFGNSKSSITRIIKECQKNFTPAVAVDPYLKLFKDINIHTNVKFRGSQPVNSFPNSDFIGGVSALSYDDKTGDLYALSDVGSSRLFEPLKIMVYKFKLDKNFELRDNAFMIFSDDKNTSSRVDLEGFVRTNDGKFIISSEGAMNEKQSEKKNADAAQAPADHIDAAGINAQQKKDGPADTQANQNAGSTGGAISSVSTTVLAPAPEATPVRRAPPAKPHFITVFNNDLSYNSFVTLPSEFDTVKKSRDDGKYNDDFAPTLAGMQTNKGIEGLTISPSNDTLFAMNEAGLIQDLDEKACNRGKQSGGGFWGQKDRGSNYNSNYSSNFGSPYSGGNSKGDKSRSNQCGTSMRLVTFKKKNGKNFSVADQYLYNMEPEVENGASELLAIDDENLLVLERSWDESNSKLTARIYKVTLDPLSLIEPNISLLHTSAKPLTKKLILDLDTIRGDMKAGFRNLENYEAMTFGPKSPNGRPTLIIGSDNNFSQRQRTSILIFEIMRDL